jgi:tight adherence protein C
VLASSLLLWVGATLVLGELRRVRRRSLVERIGPYVPRGAATGSRTTPGALSVGSLRDVVGPLAASVGGRFARIAGVDEPLAVRLERVHDATDVATFRVRQLGWAVTGLAVGAAGSAALVVPPALGLAASVAGAALGFLLVEHRLASRSTAWQHRVLLELPVVAEQLGMLLSAGFSLGGAINRLAARGTGAVGRDLGRVAGRVRQGLSEVDALREWAALVDVDAVDRLVSVLALDREAGDLGRLIGEEARAIRRDVHRRLVETMERRAQQVWIPVTVATLLPGVLFMAVPFIEALRVFSGE